ncbi:MAG: hypothetical protein H0Z32_15270 [Bacillaceae bacterium]|nr:hypothetical protein [Bacillaceae bacterium]
MKKHQQMLYKELSPEINKQNLTYIYEYQVYTGYKTFTFTIRDETHDYDLKMYGLKLTEIEVRGDDEMTCTDIDFGLLAPRNDVIRHLLSNIKRKKLTSLDEIREFVRIETQDQIVRAEKDAIAKLRVELGYARYNPLINRRE